MACTSPRLKHDLSIHEKPKILEKSGELEQILKTLNHEGTFLWKVRSTSKWFRRKYYLDLSAMRIKYETTYKNNCVSGGRRDIDLTEIHDVRPGWKTDTFNKVGAVEDKRASKIPGYVSTVEERACFSVIYGPKTETLDLVAPNAEVADHWIRALRYVLSWHSSREQERSYENWLRKKFAAADLDQNKCLSFAETLKLLAELNINMSEHQAKRLFNEANTTRGSGSDDMEVLDEDEFIAFYFRLLQRPEIEKLFESYASNGVLTANRLCQFLQKEQGGDYQDVTIQECEALISIYEQSDLKAACEMTSSGFVNMLLSPKFELFNQDHKRVYQDMTQPLTHYFIATSHNTYLLGNQFSSASSVEGYVNALKRGCRCVELDIWDGADGEPIICHGYTLTSKIPFKEVLKDAIKRYAFVASEYPLILSLENHCTQPFQQKVAEYLREILGDLIYTEPVTGDMKCLPSPDKLRNKIIIKAKKTQLKLVTATSTSTTTISTSKASSTTIKEETSKVEVLVHHESISSTSKKSDVSSSGSTKRSIFDEIDPGSSKTNRNVEIKTYRRLISDSPQTATSEDLDDPESDSSEEEEVDDTVDFMDNDQKKHNKRSHDEKVTSFDLNQLINIMQGAHFHSFFDSKLKGKCYQINSFKESKALKFIESQGEEFVEFNTRIMSRIYPDGSRTRSSNFEPMQFWAAGCQCVALNYQTEDVPNFYNYGWFTENGSCGYLLKPEFLRNPDAHFNPSGIMTRPSFTLKLRIISAQHLPKLEDDPEIVDPYVEVKVIGLPQDYSKFTTQMIHNNGFNPIWDATFDIRVRCPELAMLYFCIKDHAQSSSDTPLAYYAIPFSAIETGYRHIHLVNIRGNSLAPSTLFVHVSMSN